MSHMKAFAHNLARCIFELHMSDEDILSILLPDFAEVADDELAERLAHQIQAVRNQPELFWPDSE